MPEMTLVKMSTDIPWPTPRWVIELGQPHHHDRAPGHGEHDQQDPGDGEVGDEVHVERGAADQAAAAVVERIGEPGRLHDGEGDGHVPGDLGQLGCPLGPSSRHCSNFGITTISSWMMIELVM